MGDLTIINANVGKTNVVSFGEFYTHSTTTLDDIIDMIIPMSGPNALTDLVITRHSAGDYMANVFSNDGIHLLKSMAYISPIEKYVADYVRYIAERVERAAADGTSTAIYFAAYLIKQLLSEVSAIRLENKSDNRDIQKINNITTLILELSKSANYVFDSLINSLESMRIDIKSAGLDLKKTIISKLAHTTSKGNRLLTEFAVDIFSNLPEELYEHITYRRDDTESETDFRVDIPDYDAIVNIVASPLTPYNSKLSTELIWESCDLLICPSMFESGIFVNEYIRRRNEEYKDKPIKPLVILYTGANDQDLIAIEKLIDVKNTALCRHTVYNPAFINNPLELNIIQAMGNIDPIRQMSLEDVELSVIRDVKCRIYGNELYIHNLFINEGSYIHPSYLRQDHHAYNKLRIDLEDEIKRLKTSHGKDSVRTNLNELVRLYRLLICSRLPVLTIGGSTVNHLANINVVDDVLGVVSVAMRHGVIIDMIPKIQYTVAKILEATQFSWLKYFNEAILNFIHLTYGQNYVDTKFAAIRFQLRNKTIDDANMDEGPQHMDLDVDMRDLVFYGNEWYDFKTEGINSINVVQSYKAMLETLTRLKETIPRLICTDRIIVQDGVMDTKKE